MIILGIILKLFQFIEKRGKPDMSNWPVEAIVVYLLGVSIVLIKTWRNKIDISKSPIYNQFLNKLVFSWVALSLLITSVAWVFIVVTMVARRSFSHGLQALADLYVYAVGRISESLASV